MNVVTRRGEVGDVSAEATAGAFGTYTVSADTVAPVGPFSLFAAASGEMTEGISLTSSTAPRMNPAIPSRSTRA